MISFAKVLRGRAAGALPVLALVGALLPSAARSAEGAITVQWFGQSAFKITSVTGKVLMVDPFLTKNPKTPAEHKELSALGELPQELSPRFNKGGVIQPLGEGIRITMTRAEHSSEYRWTNPQTGKQEVHVGGEPAGFIIQLENGFRIYHMGETGLFGDLAFIADYYRPDLVLIPIGGYFVMDPKDAAPATRHYLKPRFAIPMHYGTNPMLKGTPEQYVEALGQVETTVLRLQAGEKVQF